MMYGENSDIWTPKKISPETSDFSLRDDDWDSLLGCISGRKIVNEDWPDLMRDALKRSNPYCSYGFQRHEIYRKKNGEISMYFIGACRIPPLPKYNIDPLLLEKSFHGNVFGIY